MKKLLFVLMVFSLTSCYKVAIDPQPKPKLDCSDVLVYKNHYWSNIMGKFIYTMQWKKQDGSYYNLDAWGSLYWSKVPGERMCN